jgi:hypothetical protein
MIGITIKESQNGATLEAYDTGTDDVFKQPLPINTVSTSEALRKAIAFLAVKLSDAEESELERGEAALREELQAANIA